MGDRSWQMRLEAEYQGDQNAVTALRVERLVDDSGWQPFDLTVRTPGFVTFLYALFTCQHQYMHLNAAERGLVLAASRGTMLVVASEGWMLQRLAIAFEADLLSGTVEPDAVDYICQRMQNCPVSRNIRPLAEHESLVSFIPVAPQA